MKTTALIVIGDEILTGKVKDENSFVYAKTMFDCGVSVKRIVIVPDDVTQIAEITYQYSSSFDYVLTSGGVGPTHDYKTFLGIASGFGLRLSIHDEALHYFRAAQMAAGRGDVVSEANLKMLYFPKPCQVHFLNSLWLPLVVVNNVYVFPGVPYLFQTMMTGFSHLFACGKFYRRVILTDRFESKIAIDLKAIQDQYPDVSIGSYPQMPGKPYKVMVTVEGEEEERVGLVATHLLPLFGGRPSEKG